nr:putative reverse transcriptase domain-containing protein [Tanacetum cinerariifolium]
MNLNPFWPSCNDMKHREGLFLVDIRRLQAGVKLLGGAVSKDAYFISGLVIRRATNTVDFMSLLPQLHDPQSELLLLRSRMGIAKLFFGLRTCQPVHMEEVALFFDKGLRGSIENIVVCGRPFFEDLQSDFTNKDTAPSKAQQTLVNVLFSEMVKDIEVHFDMTMRHKAVFECLRAPHAQDFLLAIPIDRLGQHISLVEYHIILKYRLMIPLLSVDAICPVCRKACLDSFGEHVVHCKELPGFNYRHDMLRDVLFHICRRAGISAKKALVNFITNPSDGRSTFRPANVLVFGWVGGKHACVDLTRVSLLMGL